MSDQRDATLRQVFGECCYECVDIALRRLKELCSLTSSDWAIDDKEERLKVLDRGYPRRCDNALLLFAHSFTPRRIVIGPHSAS